MAGAVCAGAGEFAGTVCRKTPFFAFACGQYSHRRIWAKPTVDMVLEASGAAAFERLDAVIPTCGYIRMRSEEGRVSFNRGYTPEGFAQEVFHLHLRLPGDADEVFFRDHLNLRPDLAAEYERLKLALFGSPTNATATVIPSRQGRLRAARDGGGETVFWLEYCRRSLPLRQIVALGRGNYRSSRS